MASTLGSEDSASRLNGPMLTYLKSTCHPWVSLLFLVPLLAAYEGGILWQIAKRHGKLLRVPPSF
jgi:hypothetical protein